MMPFLPAFSVIAISALYCVYARTRISDQLRQRQLVRERVAELLWAVAQRGDQPTAQDD